LTKLRFKIYFFVIIFTERSTVKKRVMPVEAARTTFVEYDNAYNIIMDKAHRKDFHELFAEPTLPTAYYLPPPPPPPVLTPDLATPPTPYYHPGHYEQDHAKPHPPRDINLFAFLQGAKIVSTNTISFRLPACEYLKTCESKPFGVINIQTNNLKTITKGEGI
jgi:hypothetical protein